MNIRKVTWTMLIAGAHFGSQLLRAQEPDNTEIIRQLQRKVEELEQKVKALETKSTSGQTNEADATQRLDALDKQVKVLERKREVDAEEATESARSLPTVSLGQNGLVVRSGDSNFLMNIHGYVQADARFYVNEHSPANDTFLLRRVRPIIEGTVFDRFDYRFMPDFGSGNVNSSSAGNNALLDDAYINARLWPQIQVQAGKYKSPVGLERLQSSAELLFIETGYATQLTPNYDLGVEVHNNLFNSPISYAIGVFNGAIDAGSSDFDTTDEGKDVAGRLFSSRFCGAIGVP